jgi:hypothetical protein
VCVIRKHEKNGLGPILGPLRHKKEKGKFKSNPAAYHAYIMVSYATICIHAYVYKFFFFSWHYRPIEVVAILQSQRETKSHVERKRISFEEKWSCPLVHNLVVRTNLFHLLQTAHFLLF